MEPEEIVIESNTTSQTHDEKKEDQVEILLDSEPSSPEKPVSTHDKQERFDICTSPPYSSDRNL